jgi:ketosteroid isomerase-like protein
VPRFELAHRAETEITANSDRFSAALESGDGLGAAMVYAEEALLLPPTGDVISGREAIERFWRSGIEIGLRTVELEPLGRGGTGSVMYEHGRYRMLLELVDDRSKVERGAYVVVQVQADEDSPWHWAVNAFGATTVTPDVQQPDRRTED